jgi:AcrR family transcriptional regulator
MPVITSLGHSATRAKLLQGTARAIAQRGVDDTTVEDILKASRLSRRTFYQSFGSKEEALVGLFEIVTQTMLQTIRDASVSPDPVEQILEGMDAYLALWSASPKVSLVLQTEAMRSGSALAPLRERTLDALSADCARAHRAATGESVDPLVFRAMHLALEGLLAHAAEVPAVTHDRVCAVIEPLVRHLLAPVGAPLPTIDAAEATEAAEATDEKLECS